MPTKPGCVCVRVCVSYTLAAEAALVGTEVVAGTVEPAGTAAVALGTVAVALGTAAVALGSVAVGTALAGTPRAARKL